MLQRRVAPEIGSISGICLKIVGELAAQGAHILINGFGDAQQIEEVR